MPMKKTRTKTYNNTFSCMGFQTGVFRMTVFMKSFSDCETCAVNIG